MNLIEKYKQYKERLKADREAFESSLTSVQKKENIKEEAAKKSAATVVSTPSASLSQQTSPAKSSINAQAQNETASHTMRQAVPPSPSMMSKKAIMMPATSNAQTHLLPPGAVLMKGPPPSGAKIMMHNPATAALSSTTSVAASRPLSPRVSSANTSQTMIHGNIAQVQGTPLLGAQRLASPPLQRMTPSNNSFMVKTPLVAPLSSSQLQHPPPQQQRVSPPGAQMVRMAPSPMHARLSASQSNLHPTPPQLQTAMKIPLHAPPPPPPQSPHSNTQKITMGMANMRPNIVQPPNMLAAHKVALPAPPAGGKVGMKAPPVMPTSPQRVRPGVAQTQLAAGAINKNVSNNNNIPPSLSPASLQAAPHNNYISTAATLTNKNTSFARSQQSPGNSTSNIPINATAHTLATNQNVQSSSSTPPPAPSRVSVNNVRGQGAVAKPTQPVHANTGTANQLLERETSTPMFMENDELSEIQFHVEPTPQAASTLSDVRSDKTDEIKFEEIKVEEPPTKRADAKSNNATDTTNITTTTSLQKAEKDNNSNTVLKNNNSYSVSASRHPRSSSESSADFAEETVAPRDGESKSESKNRLHLSNSKLHKVANDNAELHEIKPLESTSRPSTSRRKISVRRRRRRRHSDNSDENDSNAAAARSDDDDDDDDDDEEEENEKRKSIDRKKHHHHKKNSNDNNNNNSDTSYNANDNHAKHKSNSVVTEIYKDDKQENLKDNHHHRRKDRNSSSKQNSHVSEAKNRNDSKALHADRMPHRKEDSRKQSTSNNNNKVNSTRKTSLSSSSSEILPLGSTLTSTKRSSSSSSSLSSSRSHLSHNHHKKTTTLSSKEPRRKSDKKHEHHHHHYGRSSSSSRRRRSENSSTDDNHGVHRRTLLPVAAERTTNTTRITAAAAAAAAKLDPRFTASELSLAPLTSSLRTRIAEQFLSILCPQQYYGIVKKIHNIRPIHADRRRAVELHDASSILVATKGTKPNRYFYPQLRLDNIDGEHGIHVHDKDQESVNDAIDTPIILYEAAPGTMLFANNELDAARLLQAANDDEDEYDEDGNDAMTNAIKQQVEKGKRSTWYANRATSCFVVSKSAILFRQPERNVVPIAQLSVRWVPYASPSSEPQCAIHKKQMQLFAPESKELVCALCAHKSGINTEELIVIPDVIKTNSRRRLFELLQRQLEKATRITNGLINQHQRLAKLKNHQKEAIDQQFDLLRAALESKRKEFYEAAETEYNYAMSEVARSVLSTDEKIQLLEAASTHLHGDITKPLYSMQIATIAEGLEVMRDKTLHLSKTKQQQEQLLEQLEPDEEYRHNRSNPTLLVSRAYNYAMPSLTYLTPNLEKVMVELQSISAMSPEMLMERHTQTRRNAKTQKNVVQESNSRQNVKINSQSSSSPVSYPLYATPQSRSRTAPLRRSFTSPLLPRHAFNNNNMNNDGDYINCHAKEKEEWEQEEEGNENDNVQSYMWPAYHRHISSRSNRANNNSHERRINYNNEKRERAKSHSAWERRNRNKTLSWHANTYDNNRNMINSKAFRTIDDALASYEQRSSLTRNSPQQRRQENGKIESYQNERHRLLRSAPEHALESLLELQEEEKQQQQRREREHSFDDSLVSERGSREINGQYNDINSRNGNYRKMLSLPYVVIKAGSDADNISNRFPDERATYDTSNVPNSSGTFLFDFPIHELFTNTNSATIGNNNDSNSLRDMLSESYNSNNNNHGINGKLSPLTRRAQSQRKCFAKERVVRWHVRVDDAGDWVGIGAGVGCTLSQWIQSKQNDFSHLWIVPQSSNAQTFVLEVRVRRGVSHAKLTVYDLLGKQLDEGNIPQWNANRPCYPQATFGGRTGVVRIIESPHLVYSSAYA